MPRKPKADIPGRSAVTVRLPNALLDRVEEERLSCRPVPAVQSFYQYLLEQGLKSVEAPK